MFPVDDAQAYVRLTKQFRELYLQRTGLDVRFRLTFAGSGVQVCWLRLCCVGS